MAELALQGLHIMLTRPAHQSQHLRELIEAQGGTVLDVPVMEITPPTDTRAVEEILRRLDDYHIAIFISANAVDYGLALLQSQQQVIPPTLQLAAVGRRTAAALETVGQRVTVPPPPPYNSEALLTSPALQHLQGQRVVIFRGEGGRELLADTLRARGAQVDYAEVYRRDQPPTKLSQLLTPKLRARLDSAVVTSHEGLTNLLKMAGDQLRPWLLNLPLVVISERVATAAQTLGFRHPPTVAPEASDEGLVAALLCWRAAHTNSNLPLPRTAL